MVVLVDFTVFKSIRTVCAEIAFRLLRADAQKRILALNAVARHDARKAYLLRRGDADGHIAERGKAALNEVDRINGKQRAAARLFLRPDRLDRAPDVEIDDAVEGIKLRRV